MFCSSGTGCGVETVDGKAEPTGEWKDEELCGGAIDVCEPNIWLYDRLFMTGEPTGENVNCWFIGPAELMIVSLSRLKASMLKGIDMLCVCGAYGTGALS